MLLRGANMKVRIVGAGQVGSACLLSMVLRGSASEIVLINRDYKKARGVATDVRYGAFIGHCQFFMGRFLSKTHND
jgi:malate/lactate dehydrogenase